jgi:formylglycine-generating enzyme required for sulfatase activity
MLRTSLRQATLTSLTLGSLLQAACAQAPAKADPTPTPAQDDPIHVKLQQPGVVNQGLPTFLLLVPGGKVQVGLTAKDLVECTSEAVSPMKPAYAVKQVDKFSTAMKRTASSMGQKSVMVEPFLLGMWNVKCSEYETYVIHKRALKQKVRPPFIWWRYGAKKDYESKLEDIGRQFPKDPNGAVLYWERFGDELPYALVDDRGQSIAENPVSHVSYQDALEFAGWLGMRLPDEYEWTRAARGDGTNRWPWGTKQADHYAEACLAYLSLDKSAGQRSLPAGSIANATGPYGHQDMFGRIWQIVAGIGYNPINGSDAFNAEFGLLQKDKMGALLQSPPSWKNDRCLAKGGSYLSWQEPIQMMIDARAPMSTRDVLEGAGFRLAKSMKPGFDMLFSLVRGQYNRGAFAPDQELDEPAQVGAERYELGANGFPTAYHAVSFMPVQWLTSEKNGDLAKLLERSQTQPLLIGAFATTEALVGPDVPAGLYTVLYRKEGIPKDLVDAEKQGYKEVQAALKAKAKGGEEKPADEKAAKKGSWREVCARYGITEADFESKDAANGLKFVRIDGVQVPIDNDCFLLLHSVEGKLVAAVPGTNHRPATGTAFVNSLTFEKGEKADKVKSIARFRIGVPVKSSDSKRIAEFHFQINPDCAAPSAEVVWRLPGAAVTAPAPGASGSAVIKTNNVSPK